MAQYSSYSSNPIALAVTMGLASILAVLLRILARRSSKVPLGLDDIFAVVALCGLLTFLGSIIYESYNGLGYDNRVLPPKVLGDRLKAVYIAWVLAPLPSAAGRFSLLYLYNRIFKSDSKFAVAVRILGIVNGLWYVGFTLTACLRCVPLTKFWNRLEQGHCINGLASIIMAAVADSFLDFSMMILPISVLKRLQMSMQRKINLAIIFAVGGFVGCVSIIRVALTYRSSNISLYETDIWLCIQLGFSVICCCLPTYGPILPKDNIFVLPKTLFLKLIGKFQTSATQRAGTKEESTSRKDSRLRSQIGRYGNFGDESADQVVLTKIAGRFESSEEYIVGKDFPMSAISVESTV